MRVFEDFFLYETGIYEHVEGDYLGKHSVKIVGWGSENGIKYWICANTWTD